jgi:murein DD-endopeptidase MepM/ murein hydrolase activator NlpD
MHKITLGILLITFLGGTIWIWGGFGTNTVKTEDVAGDIEMSNDVEHSEASNPVTQFRRYTVVAGDTFTKAMESLDISYTTALAIVDAASTTFDFTRIRDGKTFVLEYHGDTDMFLRYEPDSERVIVVDFTQGEIVVREEAIEYDIKMKRAHATIESSLFMAGMEAGLEDALILEIADIFAWTIDFATQVQSGDSFRIYYEERYRDGTPAGFGNILAAEFVNNGRSYYGYLFEDTEGTLGYYDEDGNSLIKQFLRAPLTYNRITSGFSYSRFHPTLGVNTPHRAIDYAAPMGTPVLSVGDGTVVFAGWGGGYGNFVKIRHNSTYQTHYAHLSRYGAGISVGAQVEQGQIIGYVGSTGYSTGPHLHYEIQKNGTLVNPLEVELPPGDPVPSELKDAFTKRKDVLHKELTK